MDTKTALGAAGGIALTVVGAMSALALTFGVGPSSADQNPLTTTIEYVDQYGNPIDLHQSLNAQLPEITVRTEAPGTYVEEYEEEDEAEYGEYEDGDYEDGEYEDGDYEEYEEEDDD